MNLGVAMDRLRVWIPWRAGHHGREEPGEVLFHGLRLKLTLWYSGVLGLFLLAGGVGLYFALDRLLLDPVATRLNRIAGFETERWTRNPTAACAPPEAREEGQRLRPFLGSPRPSYVACVDASGRVTSANAFASSTNIPDAFLATPLPKRGVRDRETATDVIDGGEDIGPVFRITRAVHAPESDEFLGMVVVGQSIGAERDALGLLGNLLLALGVLAVAGSAGGGLFLASRALEPARLAFARQREFIADASHELRTPLTLLRGNAELLLRHRDRFTPDDAELLEDIVAETAHMDGLAGELLTLARLESGAWTPEREVVDLAQVAAGVARRAVGLATQKGLTIQDEPDGPALMLGDRQALDQVALILVENAIKYTPSGGMVTLSAGLADHHARLTVRDTGIGIPQHELQQLGQRFYRVDHARVRETGGAGLGLAIAFRIAAAHGGDLRFSSVPGEGTSATLTLPAGLA